MKHFARTLFELAAAFLWTLLLFVVPANAQTITNTAQAQWLESGVARAVDSNMVNIAVTPLPATLDFYRPLSGGGNIPVRAPVCRGSTLPIFPGSANASVPVGAVQATEIRAGEVLILRFSAAAANRDANAIDQVTVTLTTTSGDREELQIFETGNNTGVFTGAIRTDNRATYVSNDCELSIVSDESVTVAVLGSGATEPVIISQISALTSPQAFIFDSEDGTPVSGAQVTLIDTATGAPAVVFAADGVTRWPSRMTSGEDVVDDAGIRHRMMAGEFRFPLLAPGQYRIVVEPPAPYSRSSELEPSEMDGLNRPTGGEYIIVDPGSYGEQFNLTAPTAIVFDIPLDRPNVATSVSKVASRDRAQPGDAVFYTVTAQNPDASHVKRGVTLVDTPSPWLRLRPDSVRINGEAAGKRAVFSEDGRKLSIALDPIPAGGATRVTYAATVRADAPAGQAINRVVLTDRRGVETTAEAAVRIEDDIIASRMTIIGRVSLGPCSATENRPGIPGVRVMLEDGSFAITDRDGRYHFEGVVPGTHVVQVQSQTLPGDGKFVDCDRSTRSAGSAISRFVIGQGGSLAVADFHADIPGWTAPQPETESGATQHAQANNSAATDGAPLQSGRGVSDDALSDRAAAGADTDWLALGDGPTEFLFPAADHNPRIPSVRVAIRHEADQTVELLANGTAVDPVTFEGAKASTDRSFAVSHWRSIALGRETTHLKAIVRNADGSIAQELTRDVAFISSPWRAELIREQSKLIADGETRPVAAIRFTDRRGRPVRSGVTGTISISEPYESAALLDQLQQGQLTGRGSASAKWVIQGDDGIALVELAPTMISGPLRISFNFVDGEISREQDLDGWVAPGDLDWTIIGLAEGSVGARSVADNMERTGRFDSDLGDDARVALYAKGRVMGSFLLTLAYDSAKQDDQQRLLGAIDPSAYYTVFADGSDRRFDAASHEKLYVRIETATFYALYGDFVTGFDKTVLARYQRTATGVKAEGQFGNLHAQAFGAKVASRYRRDEIQGNGLTGPYRLSDRNIIANSEKVAIEVRDRFRSEIIVTRRELTRFIDYDIDVLSGTISFKEPVLSRDFDLNPQFIVIDYEVDERLSNATWNAGVRADYSFGGDRLRIGATAITDKGDAARTDLGAVDIRARIGDATEIRAELGVSRQEGDDATAWLIEAEHRTGSLDLLAYARSVGADYGTGQQSGAEIGRRKIGADARYEVSERLSFVGSAWLDDSLSDATSRRAVQLSSIYRADNTELRAGISQFSDHLADGTKSDSTLLEGGVTQRLLNGKLELGASSAISLGSADSVDLPARHRLRARYALTDWLRVVGNYEIADGAEVDARTFNAGFEMTPWQGSRVVTTLGQQDIGEQGKRSYAAFGLAQSFVVSSNLTLDATIDGNKMISGGDLSEVVNPDHPMSSGGHLSQNGSLIEDFTAVTLGASWRKDSWSFTARGEYRDGELADRKGITAGIIRQLGDGFVVGSGFTWTRADSITEASSEIADAAVAVAYRPMESEIAFLGKLEFRSDSVTNAVGGEISPEGRTALNVTGDAKSQRLIASLSTNWSPHGTDDGQLVRRTEIGLFTGARYNFDQIEGFDLSGTTLLGGIDARIGLGERFEVGGAATVRANITDGTTSFAVGPQIGFVPTDGALIMVGYNISGFRDNDFSAARNTDRGIYASVRLKFDADSFSSLGLGR